MLTRNRLVPVTDEPAAAHHAGGKWNIERTTLALLEPYVTHMSSDSFSLAGMLALRLVVPADQENLPAAKIIELRKRYGADFDAFHNSVAVLAVEIGKAFGPGADPTVVRTHVENEVRVRFEQPLRELATAMRGLRVDAAFAAASIKFELPAAIAAGAGGLLAGAPIIAAGGAIAVAAVALARSITRSRSEALRPSATSYLIRTGRTVSPRKLIKWTRQGWMKPNER
jgi:hypothetical protein